MSKMKRNNNLTAKLLALIIAVILWSYVMGEVNPVVTREFSDIEIEFENKDILDDEGLVLLTPASETISVSVAGKKSDIDNKFSANNISAKVDLSKCEPGKNTVPVNIKLINNMSSIRLVDYNPSEIVIDVDELSEERKEISIEFEGELDENYSIGEVELETNFVKLRGPKTYLSKVNKVIAKVDLSKKTKTFDKAVSLEILDAEGNHIRGLLKEPSMINLKVPIFKKGMVPIKLITKNKLPEDYILSDLTLIPDEVSVHFTNNKPINHIKTKVIDINDLIGKNSIKIDLDVPEGIILEKPNEEIILKYNLRKVDKKVLSYSTEELDLKNLDENLDIEYLEPLDTLDIIFRDDKGEMIKKEDLKIYIDLTDLDSGEHVVPIKVEDIDSSIIENIYPKEIRIRLKEK